MAKCGRLIASMLAAALVMAGTPARAMAAQSRDGEITSVTLKVTSTVSPGTDIGDVTVTTTGHNYSVVSYDFVSAKDEWKPGDIPKVEVILEAEEDYYFSKGINNSKVKVSGGTASGVKRLDSGSSLEVTIKLKPVKGELEQVEEAYWVTNPKGKAKWSTVNGAGAYEVRLYRGSTMVKKVDRTTTTAYDFYSYMTKSGDYEFWVRAIPKNADEAEYVTRSDWQISDELHLDKSEVASSNVVNENKGGQVHGSEPGQTQGTSPSNNGDSKPEGPGEAHRSPGNRGWQTDNRGSWYVREDGSWPSACWEKIGEKWYLFDVEGYMLTGWQTRGDKTYYLAANGEMVTGWVQSDREWYYMNEDGSMRTGWLDYNGRSYYLYSNGNMAVGWLQYNGKWYYFDPKDGHSVTDQVVERYYLDKDGVWDGR